MNEKIVIIGNGFDLRHFLPTKYNHLIAIFREIEGLTFNNRSVSFLELFGGLFKERDEWFFNKICKYYNTSQIHFENKYLENIQIRLKSNKWFQYLKSIEDSKIETWIDFETEINRVLINILKFFNDYKVGTPENKVKYNNSKETFFYVPLNEYRKVFDSRLQYNILENFLLFTNHKNHLLIANDQYLVSIKDELQYFKEKEFFDSIYNSLEDFIGIFNDYIVNIVNKFYANFNEKLKENFIFRKDSFLFDNVSRVFSFNYTQTINNLYKHGDPEKNSMRIIMRSLASKKLMLDFLHGEAIKDWKNINELKIVLGVDEVNKNLKSHKLFQFTKYFQKLHNNTDYLFLDEIIKDLDNKYKGKGSYTFYFWGHSLDSSDSEYVKDVFKIAEGSDSKIKVFYHSIAAKADQLKNLLYIIEQNRIENLMKNQRLIFIESTSDNLFEELC